MGGLTVMRALKARLPNESFVYLGDTARLPYGTKTITRQGMTIDIERALESSNRLVNDAANAYPMSSGMPSDAWFASDWELIIISA